MVFHKTPDRNLENGNQPFKILRIDRTNIFSQLIVCIFSQKVNSKLNFT